MHCIIMFIFVLIIIAVIILLIVKLASNFTAMKPYNGYECLVGKTVVIIGGSKGMLMVLIKKIITLVQCFLRYRFGGHQKFGEQRM